MKGPSLPCHFNAVRSSWCDSSGVAYLYCVAHDGSMDRMNFLLRKCSDGESDAASVFKSGVRWSCLHVIVIYEDEY